jgi:hypothetical protein
LMDVSPQGHWQPPSGGRPDVPAGIDKLIESGLSNRPGGRPQSAAQYRERLSEALSAQVLDEPQPVLGDVEHSVPKAKNNPMIFASVIGIAIIVLWFFSNFAPGTKNEIDYAQQVTQQSSVTPGVQPETGSNPVVAPAPPAMVAPVATPALSQVAPRAEPSDRTASQVGVEVSAAQPSASRSELGVVTGRRIYVVPPREKASEFKVQAARDEGIGPVNPKSNQAITTPYEGQ